MKGRTQELNKQLKVLLTVGGAKAGGRYRGPMKKLKRLQAQARRPKAKGPHPVKLLNIGPT